MYWSLTHINSNWRPHNLICEISGVFTNLVLITDNFLVECLCTSKSLYLQIQHLQCINNV